MHRSFAMVWSCVMIAVLCFTAEGVAAQRPGSTPPSTPTDCDPSDDDDGDVGETPTTPPGNGGQTPGNGGQTPGNGGQTPGNGGGQTPGNGRETPGNGGEDPGEQPSELTPFEELICQLIAEEIVFGNQDFGLLLYFIFAADDEVLADCVIENVFELYLMGTELPMQ